jgi:hypothetical protein
VRVVNQTLNGLQLEKHPEKTFIGTIERGCEFLGHHFRPGRLTVAQKTVERFVIPAWHVRATVVSVGQGGGCPRG